MKFKMWTGGILSGWKVENGVRYWHGRNLAPGRIYKIGKCSELTPQQAFHKLLTMYAESQNLPVEFF